MSVLNRSIVDAINKSYIDVFEDTVAGVSPLTLESLGLLLTINGKQGTGKTVNVAWMRSYVRMREWIGDREVTDSEVFEYLLHNRLYEATMRTEITDIEDGVYILKGKSDAEELGEAYRMRKNEEIQRLVDGIFTDTNTLDGVPLVSASHPYGKIVYDATRPQGQRYYFDQAGTYSNLTTGALTEDKLWAARQAFLLRKDYKGQPLGVMPDVLWVGPQTERTAMQIVTRSWKETGSNGAAVDNETKNMFRVVVDPRISDARWFLVASNPPTKRKPFIFWDRVPPQLQMLNATASRSAEGTIDYYTFMSDAILHGVRARMGVGYGSPEYIYGSTGS